MPSPLPPSLLAELRHDPFPALAAVEDPALAWWVARDLRGGKPAVSALWALPEPRRLVSRQQPDGSWRYSGRPAGPFNYSLLETFRTLRVLIGQYGFTRRHPPLARAAEYVFAQQTPEGDLRGILGNQYMPYYCGALTELLVAGGYAADPRVRRIFTWLIRVRQTDGGWLIPMQAIPHRQYRFWDGPARTADPALPSAHLATGMVIRAFAAHPRYRKHPAAQAAARLLRSRLFKADCYNDRRAPGYWTKFQYPFWWPNLLTVLDSFTRLGFEPAASRDAARWFVTHQDADGLWPTGYGKGNPRKLRAARAWIGFAICRVLARLRSA